MIDRHLFELVVCTLSILSVTSLLSPLPHQQTKHHTPSSSSSRLFAKTKPVEKLREDISRLEHEAAERLQNLLDQMEDLEQFENQETTAMPETEQDHHHHDTLITDFSDESMMEDTIEQEEDHFLSDLERIDDDSKERTATPPEEVSIAELVPTHSLEGTTWKLVFNIGREEGTWMPKEWGISGDRIRFECKVKFSNETHRGSGSEDFFQHHQRNPYRLEVTDGFLWPTGVNVGRKPLKIGGNDDEKNTPLYQIVQGTAQGDVLRMRVPIAESVDQSDVGCPAGNMYVTANYFGLPECHGKMREESRQKLLDAEQALEKTEKQRKESHGDPIWAQWKHMTRMWNADHDVTERRAKYHRVLQRYPEKNHLRFDKERKVALSREGGLCIKVHSGVAIEYHILGRVEIGCIDKHQ